jgi:hypothetical protein
MIEGSPSGVHRWLLHLQGIVYVVTGLWPVLHVASFEAVTGPKFDHFLLHTVGLLLAAIGAGLLWALRNAEPEPAVLIVAAGAAMALAGIDVVYFLNGRLPPIYLADAVMELAFMSACGFELAARRSHGGYKLRSR